MKMNKVPFLICIVLVLLVTFNLKAQDAPVRTIIINNAYITSLLARPIITRDQFVQQSANTIIQARGTVISIDRNGKFNRQFRLKVRDSIAIRHGIDIIYYIYLNRDASFEMLSPGMMYEFRGQVLFTTPLNSTRTSFGYSVLLSEGAILIGE